MFYVFVGRYSSPPRGRRDNGYYPSDEPRSTLGSRKISGYDERDNRRSNNYDRDSGYSRRDSDYDYQRQDRGRDDRRDFDSYRQDRSNNRNNNDYYSYGHSRYDDNRRGGDSYSRNDSRSESNYDRNVNGGHRFDRRSESRYDRRDDYRNDYGREPRLQVREKKDDEYTNSNPRTVSNLGDSESTTPSVQGESFEKKENVDAIMNEDSLGEEKTLEEVASQQVDEGEVVSERREIKEQNRDIRRDYDGRDDRRDYDRRDDRRDYNRRDDRRDYDRRDYNRRDDRRDYDSRDDRREEEDCSRAEVNEKGYHGSLDPDPSFEKELFDFSQHVTEGINFDNYDSIPVEVSGQDTPEVIDSFDNEAIPESLHDNILRCQFKRPTPVQKYGFSFGIAHRDMMACAQTGKIFPFSFICRFRKNSCLLIPHNCFNDSEWT